MKIKLEVISIKMKQKNGQKMEHVRKRKNLKDMEGFEPLLH